MADRGWQHFSHEADLGLEGWGLTPEIAFEQAALALTAAVTTATVKPDVAVQVSCAAPDRELLLVDWLNAVIYEMAVRNMIFGRYDVRIEGTHLGATLWGEPADPARHEPACEPKGATYTELRVKLDERGVWRARCVVDV
jgi:SHS2 domain-containing protein